MTSRVTRMGLGLVGLIPVLAVAGSLLLASSVEGAGGWILLAVAVGWVALMIWWARRAPAARSEEASARYWVALRHARFHPPNDVEEPLRHGHP